MLRIYYNIEIQFGRTQLILEPEAQMTITRHGLNQTEMTPFVFELT
jgi:hypothetical protein